MKIHFLGGWRGLIASSMVLAGIASPAFSCDLRPMGQLHVQMAGHTPLVDGAINGQPVQFILDTGSATTMLTRPAAIALHLKFTPSGGTSYGVGGKDNVDLARVQEFTIGNYSLHNLPFEVTSNRVLGASIAGLLGADLLFVYDLELDFADGAVRLFNPKECKGDQVVYWRQPYSVLPIYVLRADSHRLYGWVELNGTRTLAMFDTGAAITAVTPGGAQAARVSIESEGVTAGAGIGGTGARTVKSYSAVFPKLAVGDDESITNVRLAIADLFGADKSVSTGSHIASTSFETPAMLIGADFLRVHRVYVARSQGKIYVSYLGGPIFTDPKRQQTSAATPPPQPASQPPQAAPEPAAANP